MRRKFYEGADSDGSGRSWRWRHRPPYHAEKKGDVKMAVPCGSRALRRQESADPPTCMRLAERAGAVVLPRSPMGETRHALGHGGARAPPGGRGPEIDNNAAERLRRVALDEN
ncbi:hypothetical protein HS125_11525 [bacterium]|nr:hypothetical protein [bacterium]